MIYESTVDNLVMLVRSIGEVRRDQLLRFFRDADDADSVDYYVTQLAKERVLDINTRKNHVKFHSSPAIKDAEIVKRITAFWVVADFGSNNIREVVTMEYPSQILFVTSSNDVYDLTVCSTRMDAQLALRARKLSLPEGIEDVINHIAIVSTQKEGEALAPYQFDSFCLLDADKIPGYYTWE